MIDAKELRIGNYIYLELGLPGLNIHEVKGQDIADISNGKVTLNSMEGIPLTPELLEACGFQKDDNDYWHLEKLSIVMPGYSGYPNGRLYFNSWFIMEPPKYLHMLMNTYFFITGTELTVNLDKAPSS